MDNENKIELTEAEKAEEILRGVIAQGIKTFYSIRGIEKQNNKVSELDSEVRQTLLADLLASKEALKVLFAKTISELEDTFKDETLNNVIQRDNIAVTFKTEEEVEVKKLQGTTNESLVKDYHFDSDKIVTKKESYWLDDEVLYSEYQKQNPIVVRAVQDNKITEPKKVSVNKFAASLVKPKAAKKSK
jgi:hypothetical protein